MNIKELDALKAVQEMYASMQESKLEEQTTVPHMRYTAQVHVSDPRDASTGIVIKHASVLGKTDKHAKDLAEKQFSDKGYKVHKIELKPSTGKGSTVDVVKESTKYQELDEAKLTGREALAAAAKKHGFGTKEREAELVKRGEEIATRNKRLDAEEAQRYGKKNEAYVRMDGSTVNAHPSDEKIQAAKERSDARHKKIDASNKAKKDAFDLAREKAKKNPVDTSKINPFGGSNAKYTREEVELDESERSEKKAKIVSALDRIMASAKANTDKQKEKKEVTERYDTDLDADKDGKLSAKDFKLLRDKKKKTEVTERYHDDEDDDVRRADAELKRMKVKLPKVKHKEVVIKRSKKDKEEELDEARSKPEMKINHPSYSSAISHAEEHLNKQGYQIHPDDMWSNVSTGPSKPSEGKTTRVNIPLHKDGVPTNKTAHIQVYNRGNAIPDNMELNMYTSSTGRQKKTN
jgi:hypothetical protein